nr:unnamed protein product [Callosobruchus analis]
MFNQIKLWIIVGLDLLDRHEKLISAKRTPLRNSNRNIQNQIESLVGFSNSEDLERQKFEDSHNNLCTSLEEALQNFENTAATHTGTQVV